MNHNNLQDLARCLHKDVQMTSPRMNLQGRSIVLEIAQSFFQHYDDFDVKGQVNLGARFIVE
jgi:hypothetical protein